MKKVLSLTLCLMLLVGMFSAFSGAALADGAPAEVTEPITITFWHDRPAGVDGDYLDACIKEFNETNEYGITVEAVYQGYLDDVQAKTMTAIAAKNQPTLADLSCNAIPVLAAQDCLADLTPYIERDGFDMDNFVEAVTDYIYDPDGHIVSIPYTRGTAILYYNKTMFADAGYDHAPTSLEELNEAAQKIYADSNGEVKGIAYTIEANYYQNALIASLNGTGIMDADGQGASCLEDGTLLQFLSDWYTWTEEGWCDIPALSGASSKVQEDFLQGKLAAYVSSSNRAGTISANAAEANIDLGMSKMVGYGGYSAPIGGGSIGVISRNNSEQQIAAAWEFIKFLMQDENVASNHTVTGCLPVTYSSVETDIVKDKWAENEGFQVSYEQLTTASEIAFSTYTSEWSSVVKSEMSALIQDRSITPEDAIEDLKMEAAMIFPLK